MAFTVLSHFHRTVAISLLAVACALLLVESQRGSAAAQGRAKAANGEAADASDKEKAAELTRTAERHYNAGQFDVAAERYAEAYAAYPAPELLFNLAQCHKHLGNHRRAVFLFERYLRNKPNAPNEALVQELIAEERTKAKKQRREQARAKPKLAGKAGAEPSRKDVFEGTESEQKPVEQGSGSAIYEKWWFWTAVGAVAIAAGGTAAYLTTQGDDQTTPTGSLGVVEWR